MGEEQFSVATQQMGGNPLFQFEFSPVSERQWMKRVEKTVYRTKLRQRWLPLKKDDVNVTPNPYWLMEKLSYLVNGLLIINCPNWLMVP